MFLLPGVRCIITLLCSLLVITAVLVDCASPIRVFVLAGQSNMEGKGSVEHLRQLVHNNDTEEKYQHFIDPATDEWIEREDVQLKFLNDRQGKLTVGYGVPEGERFGVELEFGHVVGNFFRDQQEDTNNNSTRVVLLKCAWGGRALAVEFRPLISPLAGELQYPCMWWETCDPYKPIEYSNTYREMIGMIQDTMNEVKEMAAKDDSPAHLSGFVWFQGWNDFIDPKRIVEYGDNLANLIRNVRLDLDAPGLPFVIGEFGQHGTDLPDDEKDKILNFREIQANVTKMDEFRNSTKFVKTSPYVVKNAESWDADYHYYGRADTFVDMGRAFGEAMLDLIGDDLGDLEASGR